MVRNYMVDYDLRPTNNLALVHVFVVRNTLASQPGKTWTRGLDLQKNKYKNFFQIQQSLVADCLNHT